MQIKTKQFYDHIMQKLVKRQKSANNPMSSFGLIEENMELSHIHLAVQGCIRMDLNKNSNPKPTTIVS